MKNILRNSNFGFTKWCVALIAVLMTFATTGWGQTPFDTFSDSNFTANPTWGGSTTAWGIQANSDAAAGATGSNTLRLASTGGTTVFLSSQVSSWGDSQEWGVWIGRRAQAFSAANQAYFWLVANESTLNNATVDGYRLAIGDDTGGDEIRLEYVVNGAVSATVITSSGSLANGLTDIGFLVRVTRSSSGAWALFTSTLPTANGGGAIATGVPNSTNANVSQGSATHNTLVPASNNFIGVAALHSTSASAIASTEFDQIYFTPASAVTAPTVAASTATDVAGTTATLNGNVTADGGAPVTERGFVYKTSPGVTITDNKTVVSGTTGAFTLGLSSLSTGATYYFKAYAINSAGTTLSSLELSFTTGAVAPPTIEAATVATVDTAFDVTFPDDATWRGVISGVKVDGVALTGGVVVSSGKITFTPSSSAPTAALQSPGTKSITVSATGYNDATVSQVLGAGQASKLVITTQPTAPSANGGALAAQPAVALQDQFGNATASTANVTAAVGAGAWTLGGTATVAAVRGTATLSGLTATSAAAVTGATISFTSDSLTRVTSSTFDIPAPVPPGEILISQVYGAGGNSGATYNQDYVELYNPGAVDKDLTGWSIQYASNTGPTWSVQSLTGTIKAGKYFLVSLASGSIGSGLPTADYAGTATGTGSVNLSGSNGKVALANNTTAFTTAYPTGAVDFVGYGTATSFEGSAAAPAPSTTTAIFRAGNGATDSNNNSADFTAAPPNPRNSTFGEAVGIITLNPTSITNLTAPVGGVSAVQSYVVVGTNLGTTNLVVTPSLSLIQISTNASSGFSTNSIPFVPVGGVVSNTIYVRVTNATATNYSGTITNASGLASANLPVSGTIYDLAEYYSMASGNYSETFSNIASWTTPTTGSWQGLVSGGTNTIPVATNITTATLAFSGSSTTGVQKGTENLQFLTTGSTDNSTSIGLDLLLNFTGRNAGTLSFDAATVFNSTGDRVSTLRAYTSINGTDWSELTTGGLPFVSTNNVAGSSNISVSLPRSFDNAPQAQIRFYVYNGEGAGTGSRPKISIDNVLVTSTLPNSTPTDITLSANTIAENNAVNAEVGTFSTNDPDSGDTFIYTLVAGTGSTGNSSFRIVGASLQATVAFNYEANNSYSVRVRTTDSANNTFEEVFTITVTDVVEGSTFAGAYPGKSPTDIAPNGLSYLANYGFGGSEGITPTLPIMDNSDATKLRLVVVFRTDDPTLPLSGLGGETSTDLALAGSWSTSGVTVEPSTDMSPVPANTVRKVISVDRVSSESKRFLRATITK